MVSLSWVTTGGFAVLAALCICVFFGMRRLTSLAWLAATAVIATVQTALLAEAHELTLSSIAVSILTPLAYLCFGQAIRSALGQRHQNWGLYAVVGVLTVLGVGLKLVEVPFVLRTPVFQMACALALFDGFQRLRQFRQRTGVENALLFVVGGVIAIFVFRGATYPLIFPADMSYDVLRTGNIERTTLILSALFSGLAVFLLLARIINGVIAKYRLRSECDSLTGLLNHQAFHRLGGVASKAGGSVIFCDLDHFKAINDRFGHLAGDKALCAFADLLRASGYQAGRVGGEEFAVIVPGLSGAATMIEADRVRKKFSDLRHGGMPADARISASFGVAEYGVGQSPQTAFARADAALYQAKTAGRNRVVKSEVQADAESAAA